MKSKRIYTLIFILTIGMLLLAACDGEQDVPTPTPEPAATNTPVPEEPESPEVNEDVEDEETAVSPTNLLISEVLVGVPGNNNHEFIELYNPNSDPVNLEGYSLWYHLRDDQNPQLVASWKEPADVPPMGHYLLARYEEDFGLIPDGMFTVGLFEKGGLILKNDEGEVISLFGWGDAPEGSFAGVPAEKPTDGVSLERLPGADAGNGQETNDNSADIALVATASPQSSGSPLTPQPDGQVTVAVSIPDTVAPGDYFDFVVTVQNDTAVTQSSIVVSVEIPELFTVQDEPEGSLSENGRLYWTIPNLEAGASESGTVLLESPITFIDALITDIKVETEGLLTAYAGPQIVHVGGASIPIATARDLEASVVIVEGVATMYTGGFYAGSTGTKFYIEDESGGIQVYVPGGIDDVNIRIGDYVRVKGEIEYYRDSVEVIPLDFAVDIELVNEEQPVPEPAMITASDNETNDVVLGRLNMIEGTATRIEEFSYSYEIDIIDAEGTTTLVYIEKDTGVSAEPLDVGKQYQITGISEFYSGTRQFKPRLQTDIVEIFPPVLMVSMAAPNSAAPGDLVEYAITAVNHTDAPLTNLEIRSALPQGDGTLAEILDGGEQVDSRLVWQIDELAGNGEAVTVHYTVAVDENGENPVVAEMVTAVADQWTDPVTTEPFLTFVGAGGVPIWAIQGSGDRSPYVRSDATTEGIVTGVFPELNGFWLQDVVPDDDERTSNGVFVLVDTFTIPVVQGDLVQVTGRVREVSGQTTLYPTEPAQIVVVSQENALPTAVSYDPPQDPAAALAYNESLEGMLVILDENALVVAPTTKYGEFVAVNQKWEVDSLLRTDTVGFTIFVDDGSAATHTDASTQPFVVARGDVVSQVVGPLAFTFDNYKIEPISIPEISSEVLELPTLAEAGANQLTVATFNVENLFDNRDPHPSSPERPTSAQYQLRLTKLAAAIEAMGAPDIIGLQEVEHIGVLEALVELDALAAYGYEPYLIEGFDSRGIDQGYLVRSDRVTVDGVGAYNAPNGITSRPPLVITTTAHLESGDQQVIVLNNHFTSLAAGEEATEPRRTAQAAWNVTVMEQLAAAHPDAAFIVLGDLNSFYQTLPINTLQDAGLRHSYEFFGDGETLPYTYIFAGRTQSLDHILMSDGLFAQISDVQALHIGVDFPLPSPDDATALRVSDHDPLVVTFTFE